jgi:leucyl/phenylalanyl-tRNA--protein transferase
MIRWLHHPDEPFPPVTAALADPNGLLAAGGELSSTRLIDAYRHGIFPWFNPDNPCGGAPTRAWCCFLRRSGSIRSLVKALRNRDYGGSR